jgi:hypothetical protein
MINKVKEPWEDQVDSQEFHSLKEAIDKKEEVKDENT